MTVAEAINCQELVELVTDYLEGALEPADLRRFEEHLAACGKCTEYMAQLRATIRARRPDHARRSLAGGRIRVAQVFRDWTRKQVS